MNNQELLLKDFCARFPYGVKIKRTNCPINLSVTGIVGKYVRHTPFYTGGNIEINTSIIEEIKPYLRPLSSMTEKEYEELKSVEPYYGLAPFEYIEDWGPNYEVLDWLNAHHFDYRGLIKKGLALEAPEGMYNN